MISRLLMSPLPGVRIADFTRLVGGSFVLTVLRDLRAEVWKVVRPCTDAARNRVAPPICNLRFCDSMINKSWSIDLQNGVVGDASSTGGMKKFRLRTAELCKQNESFYCSVIEDENRSRSSNDSSDSQTRTDDQKRSEDGEQNGQGDSGQDGYYRVRIGEVLQQRYHVIRKLGRGYDSTVWFCWDAKGQRFVALKIGKSSELLRCVGEEENDEKYRNRLAQTRDDFRFEGPTGIHSCMVFEVLGCNFLKKLEQRIWSPVLLFSQVRKITRQLLEDLDHLHENCKIVEKGAKHENELVSLSQEQLWHMAAEALACIKTDQSEGMMSGAPVPVALDPETEKTLIDDMIIQCRSPEVIVGSEYGPAGDIWSTACIAYKLATGLALFKPIRGEDIMDIDHISCILELLGPIPKTIIKNLPNWKRLFYKSGRLRSVYKLKYESLNENICSFNCSKKNRDEFCNFLLPMMEYDPKKRATAAACLQHPWLQPQTPVALKRVSKDSGKVHEDKNP